MFNFYPYATNDGTVGLYSPTDNDIYHSSYGSVTEAYEKFILPADIVYQILHNDKLNVLDICYGIGYNSKCFLNFILNLKSKKFFKNYLNYKNQLSVYNSKIHTDNISDKSVYNDKIYVDNKFRNNPKDYNYQIYDNNILNYDCVNKLHEKIKNKIFNENFRISIDAIDKDENLVFLSPFIINKVLKNKNNKLNFKNEKIEKYLNSPNINKIQDNKNNNEIENKIYTRLLISLTEISLSINRYILREIIDQAPEIRDNQDVIKVLNDTKYSGFFSASITDEFKLYTNLSINNTPTSTLNGFLHNIYYKYISNRHKNDFKCTNFSNIDFIIKINDARPELINSKKIYDIVFLDAFTPAKCPTLWSLEFLKLIYQHLSDDGILLTYSTAAPVRNALIECGYFIGENYNPFKNKSEGTIASKNKTLIKYPLSEFNLGLLKTTAGIIYHDENLTGLNSEILERRKNEVLNSNLTSTTQYKKLHKNIIN